MASVCLYCAYEVWRFDTVRSWVLVAVMNIAMIGAHLLITGQHQHGLASVPPAATVLFVRTRAPR